MKSRLSDVPAAIRLSRATLRNIHEKPVLGILLQCDRNPAGGRGMDPAVRLEAEPDVRCGGDEPFELLRCDKRPASESVSDARRVKR